MFGKRELGVTDETTGATVWCTLVTVSYNSAPALREFWGSAGALPSGVEWIVVDNASSDDSVEVARGLGATVIPSTNNLGFSASNNRGLREARGQFIGFVNPDVRIDFSDLEGLRDEAVRLGAIVSPQLKNADGTLQPNGRGFPLLLDKIRNRLGGEAQLNDRYLMYPRDENPRAVCWLMGASVFGTREAIDQVGGWDDHFFLYYEDSDLGVRSWSAGVPVYIIPAFEWTHGWARETKGLSVVPWMRELSSGSKFYKRYPEFLLSRKNAARKHPRIEAAVFGDAG